MLPAKMAKRERDREKKGGEGEVLEGKRGRRRGGREGGRELVFVVLTEFRDGLLCPCLGGEKPRLLISIHSLLLLLRLPQAPYLNSSS